MAARLPDTSSFEPEMACILAQAVDDTCDALHIAFENTRDREVVAARIVDLARRTGVVDAAVLSDRVLRESRSAV
jgi:hypothetical protein